MTEQNLTATVHPTTASVPAAVWNSLAPSTSGLPDNPFLDHAFFRCLEEAGCATADTGWQPQHILIEDNGTPAGLMPLYLKSHSMGEYVFDHAWADAFERAGGQYYPKLQASIPFTPVTAPKLLVGQSDSIAVRHALLSTAQELAGRMGVSSVHATFVPEDEERLAAEAGWLVRHDTQFHWRNQGYETFEDFLGALASRKRKTIRRERREALSEGLEIEWLSGGDLTERHWDAFYSFYMDTGSRKWGRPYLNRKFFSLLSEAMGDRIVLMLARDGDTYIAGALNLVGHDVLYGRYWGATRDVPFLHFELCYYQAIDYAIAHKLGVVEAGAQGEHKLARGYEPTLTRSLHWITHAGLRSAVSDYLLRERQIVDHDQQLLARATPFRRDDDQSS